MLNDRYGLIEQEHVGVFEDLLRKYGNGIVLDLGCGYRDPTGNKSDLVRFLIEMDNSSDAFEFFSKLKLPPNTVFIRGDVREQPFSDGSIDLALMLGIYGVCTPISEYSQFQEQPNQTWWDYIKNVQDRLISETHRVLRPGGTVLVSNSTTRQPLNDIIQKFEKCFDVLQTNMGDERYLILFRVKKP